jgi:cytochrome c oxidase subunit 2
MMKSSIKAAAAALVAMFSVAVQALERYQLDLAPPATKIAEEISGLHHYVMGVCLVIFIFVFVWMAYSILKHRKSVGHTPAQFHENTTVEIIWTVIPFIIVVALAVPATRIVVAMKDTSNAEITVKATGVQWKWAYDYLKGEGEGISFVSNLSTPRSMIDDKNNGTDSSAERAKNEFYLREVDQALVVPVNTKIRVITTAADVIHAWYVPEFGVKQDAIPGFVRDAWFRAERVGTFRGQCAELCGKDHAFMPIVVEVKSKEDYAAWVKAKKKELGLDTQVVAAAATGTATDAAPAVAQDPNKVWQLADLKANGEKIFAQNCAACHQLTGKGIPGTFPALDGSKVVNGVPELQISTVLKGVVKNGTPTAMASWAKLSDVELASVITYTKNSWGNATGQVVQPKQVAALRGK